MCDIDGFDCTSLCIGAAIEYLNMYRVIQWDFVVETWLRMKLNESTIEKQNSVADSIEDKLRKAQLISEPLPFY
jgi:hypothetical protein